MTEDQRQIKNESIKKSMQETYNRRKSQVCRVYKCKIQYNALSERQKTQLKMMFVEAKWLYNDILRWCELDENNKPWNYKIGKTVCHYNKEHEYVESELKYIHSQMKQCVQDYMSANIRTLSTLKKKGSKVGKLKYKSEIKRLHVKQAGPSSTSKLKINKSRYCKVPKVSGHVRINGLDQFVNIKNIEIACFDILNTPSGYYIAFCTYQDKDNIKQRDLINKTIGIDFGCSNSFTTSEGDKYNCYVEESDRLKHLQRQLKMKKGYKKGEKKSNNYNKLCHKIKVEYQKLSNIKNDYANKVTYELSKYKHVIIQDEQLNKWKEQNHGKKVHHSILGRVKAKLISKSNVIVINKYAPTTKLCRLCGEIHDDIKLYDRTFKCKCGVVEDRDIHAAKNLVWMYENNVGVGRTKLKLVELRNQIYNALNSVNSELAVKQEDSTL